MFPAEKSGKEVFRRDRTEDIGGAPQIVDFDTIFEFRGPETVQVRPEVGGIVRDVQEFMHWSRSTVGPPWKESRLWVDGLEFGEEIRNQIVEAVVGRLCFGNAKTKVTLVW